MARWRRLLGWLLALGLLAAVGAGVFHFVRYRPRMTIPELLFIAHLSPDGSRLVTVKPPAMGRSYGRGPLQVWDTHRGRIVHEFQGDMELWHVLAPDEQRIAVRLEDGTVRLIDWQAGRDWQIEDVRISLERARDEPWPRSEWSQHGRWLYVEEADKQSCVIDTSSRKIVLRLKDTFLRFNTDERLAFFRKGDNIDVWDLEAIKKVANLPAMSDDITVSPDGRSLLTRPIQLPGRAMEVERTEAIEVWDLATFTMRFRRQQAPAGYLQAAFSPDGSNLALWLSGNLHSAKSELVVVNALTGELRWTHGIDYAGDIVTGRIKTSQ